VIFQILAACISTITAKLADYVLKESKQDKEGVAISSIILIVVFALFMLSCYFTLSLIEILEGMK